MNALAQEALDVRSEIGAVVKALSQVEFPSNNRVLTGLSLIRASADHAAAITVLLEIAGAELGASVVVLSRSHLDKFLRGIFFLSCASDSEVAYFISKNKMPSRPGLSKNNYPLSPRNLAPLVADALELGADRNRLIRMVENHWGPMNDFTHGGVLLVESYVSDDGIGPGFSEDEMIPLLRNLATTVTLGAVAVLKASGLTLEEQQPVLRGLSEAIGRRAERSPGTVSLIGTEALPCSS